MKTLEQLGVSPYPWKHNIENKRDYKLFSVEAEDGSVMAYFDCCEEQFNLYEGFANSQLIAAAPELYDMLQSLVEYIDRECIPCGETACELMAAAHNVLAKAAGESEVKE